MDLPLELVEQYLKGRVLVFIGQGINGPEWESLGQELEGRLESEQASGARTTEEIAELYETNTSPQALVQHVLDFYRQAGGPNQAHRLLADLTKCRVFVTTCVDERLEEAFQAAGRTLIRIIQQTNAPFGSFEDTRLYKLYGTLSQPESLRLTQEQTAEALSLDQDGGFSHVVKGYLADSTIVFVGFHLDDDFFKRLYLSSIKPLHRYHPLAYAFSERDYRPITQNFCRKNGIVILKSSLSDLLVAFIRAFKKQMEEMGLRPESARVLLGSASPPPQPYKRLLSYGPEDRAIFYGRRAESEQLLALVRANQLTVLYGASGAGKSSLLGAGLVPLLEAEGYAVIMDRVLEIPTAVLRRRLASGLSGTPADESLVGLLTAVAAQRPLVILLDQFEEYFTRIRDPDRETFTAELTQALARRDLPVKWVISLRGEYLARLNELRAAIPDIFKAELYLASLNRESASQAISEPASTAHLGVEPKLLQQMLDDLGSGGWIEPPQLQIICYELYQAAISRGDNTMRLEDYQQRGGARQILAGYLEQALRRLPPPQDVQARQILIALVSGEGAPAVLSLEEITSAAGLKPKETARILVRLQDERLVKASTHEGQPVYELGHAYLADSLAVDPEVLHRKAIEEMLRRGLRDWQDHRILLSEELLRTLRNWVGKINLTLDYQELVLRSAIRRGGDLAFWLEQASPVIVQLVLKEVLAETEVDESQPKMALAALACLPQREPYIDDLHGLLRHPSLPPETRQQAAMYLAQMNPTLALETLRSASPDLKSECQQALIHLFNAQAGGDIVLDQPPTWRERGAILASRLRANAGYIVARTGTAGLAAIVGGVLGSVAGFGLIRGDYTFYMFGAAFTPFVWAAGLVLGLTLVEALRYSRRPGTWLLGAILGNLPMVLLAAVDPDPETARTGLFLGLLGAVLSGAILAATLTLAGSLAGLRRRALLAIVGATLAGLSFGLALAPLSYKTGIPGFNPWILAAILGGGSASMMLGLFLVPAPAFTGAGRSHLSNI